MGAKVTNCEPTFRKLGTLTDTRVEQRFGRAPAHMQHSARKAMGYLELTDENGTVVSGETLMCVHCQFHFVVQPGSGMVRGWCGRCSGATCGKEQCETRCIPFERAIEIMERSDILKRAVVMG